MYFVPEIIKEDGRYHAYMSVYTHNDVYGVGETVTQAIRDLQERFTIYNDFTRALNKEQLNYSMFINHDTQNKDRMIYIEPTITYKNSIMTISLTKYHTNLLHTFVDINDCIQKFIDGVDEINELHISKNIEMYT